MGKLRQTGAALVACLFAAFPVFGAKPGTAPTPPSVQIFMGSYDFTTATQIHNAAISVPQDGAWFYGSAAYAGASWMDCEHHYRAEITPASSDYEPFFTVGFIAGLDTPCVFSNACFSCSINYGGEKTLDYRATNQGEAFLPPGGYSVVLKTLNGGSTSVSRPDSVTLNLSQVNVSEMTSMSLFEALSNENPAPAPPEEVDSRAYVAQSDDRVPLVPQFTRGGELYPATPSMAFSAVWDDGSVPEIIASQPGGRPGNKILLVGVTGLKTGLHTLTITAKLPSGKEFTAAKKLFVYNVALEVLVNGSTVSTPATFTRGDTVTFRVKQQDTKGKALTVSKTDWAFRNMVTGYTVQGSGESTLAADSKEWSGPMHQGGLVTVNVTIKSGKSLRTANKALSKVAQPIARTGSAWQITRTLCENCFDDLGIKNGGALREALIFPSIQNLISDSAFPRNFFLPGVTIGLTGEKKSYEKGLLDDSGAYSLEPHTLMALFPLYRPANLKNDPEDWADRYQLAEIKTGANRGYWFVTSQNYRTEFAYAISAYFKASSAPGANPANYLSWMLTCPTPTPQESCYAVQPMPCWPVKYPGKSYYQVAESSTNPNTGVLYDMAGVIASASAHEKDFHWQDKLLDYIDANKARYDLGTIMEAMTTVAPTENAARSGIDLFVHEMMLVYAKDPNGGGAERSDPGPAFPIVQDMPVGPTAPCTLLPSK